MCLTLNLEPSLFSNKSWNRNEHRKTYVVNWNHKKVGSQRPSNIFLDLWTTAIITSKHDIMMTRLTSFSTELGVLM
ncbi:hypothetical protein Ocin01_04451 [Orchesella cincta]|uniref:Uncharacterized protein n=1 Tax=Orchesella cincta TaxID=48709 RepID=A0A1D2NAG3_ORCCI|nr:hypothetical protein Ocin01_04451 [Orchesella cincta]